MKISPEHRRRLEVLQTMTSAFTGNGNNQHPAATVAATTTTLSRSLARSLSTFSSPSAMHRRGSPRISGGDGGGDGGGSSGVLTNQLLPGLGHSKLTLPSRASAHGAQRVRLVAFAEERLACTRTMTDMASTRTGASASDEAASDAGSTSRSNAAIQWERRGSKWNIFGEGGAYAIGGAGAEERCDETVAVTLTKGAPLVVCIVPDR